MDKRIKQQFKKINALLKKSSSVLLAAHENPDADAVGSMAALNLFLNRNKIDTSFYFCGEVPPGLNFMPGIKKREQNLDFSKYDLIFCLDYGDFNRLKLPESVFDKENNVKIITIDHHLKADQRGEVVIIKPNLSSTAEIVYLFLKETGSKITSEIATSLLAGIMDDTASFSSFYTSCQTFNIASNLISKGASLEQVNKILSPKIPPSVLKIWGTALCRLRIQPSKQFAFSWIAFDELKENHLRLTQIKGVVDWISAISNASFILFLVEYKKGKVRGSLRLKSSQGRNMAQIAQALGGGGHQWAAGFTYKGSISEVLKKVENLIG